MGEIGCGTIAKLVHNMSGICTRQVVAEAFALGVKAGVRSEALLAAVKGGAFGQGLLLTQVLPEIVFKGDFDTVRFALRLARKDLGLATEDRKSTRLNSSHSQISYAVFCLKKKKKE